MARWRCGSRSKPVLYITIGAALVTVLSFGVIFAGSSWTTTATQSLATIMPRAAGYGVPHLRLLGCPSGCERHGNCNREDGTCICEFGWEGDSCGRLRLPACRSHEAENAVMSCSWVWQPLPRNCECLRQCDNYLAELGGNSSAGSVTRNAVCYGFPDLPPERQLSLMPAENDTAAKYYRGFNATTKIEINLLEFRDEVTKPPNQAGYWLPPSRCPNQCSHLGLCWGMDATSTAVDGICECNYGQQGPDCSKQWMYWGDNSVNCFRNCSNAGICKSGWCHCEPGRWGIDCSRTKAYARHEKTPRRSLRIYVQELPVTLNLAWLVVFRDGRFLHNPIYLAYNPFFSRLLGDWSVRTEDPWDADLIYVPALTAYWTGNLGKPWEHLSTVASWLQRHSELWRRHGGADHLFWFTRDKGACGQDAIEVGDKLAPASSVANSIWLTHFCYSNARVISDDSHGVERSCFDPQKDVCAVPHADMAAEAAAYYTPERLATKGHLPLGKREDLVFFNGGVRPNLDYSGGVRQEFVRLYQDTPGFAINRPDTGGGQAYIDARRNATFCLVPSGNGWGIRIVPSVVQGCIPLIIQDGVRQPYDDVLPYWRFSIRLHLADMPRLEEILRGVHPDRITAMQRGLMKYYSAFVWPLDASHPDPGPGRAYEYTIMSLDRAATNMYMRTGRRDIARRRLQ